MVIVADLGFPVWRCSFDGEIVGEFCGFQLVGDSIAAFLQSCFATTKILALMRVLGGCVSSSREVVISVFFALVVFECSMFIGTTWLPLLLSARSSVDVPQIAKGVSVVKFLHGSVSDRVGRKCG